jgi:hypothetical protein
MKVGQRIQAFSVTHAFSMNKKLDQYLSEHLPDLMDEFKVADRSDISSLDSDFEGLEKRMDELEGWKKVHMGRTNENRVRLDRLKTKYGTE